MKSSCWFLHYLVSFVLRSLLILLILLSASSPQLTTTTTTTTTKGQRLSLIVEAQWIRNEGSSSTTLEQELEERWQQLESSLVEYTNGIDLAMEQMKNGVEDLVESTTKRIHYDVQQTTYHVKRTFEKQILKQRQGLERWYRSLRNHIGIFFGTMTAYAGGLSPKNIHRSFALQTGIWTWRITNHLCSGHNDDDETRTSNGKRTEEGNNCTRSRQYFKSSKERKESVYNQSDISPHGFQRITRLCSRFTRSLLFKDLSALTVSILMLQQKIIPDNIMNTMKLIIPITSIGYNFVYSIRRIVTVLYKEKQEERREEQQQQNNRPHYLSRFHFVSQDKEKQRQEQMLQEVKKKQRQEIGTNLVVVSCSAIGLGILWIVPGVTLPMVAASLAGTTLLLDSISDEIIGNWFTMLRRMGQKRRFHLYHQIYNGIYGNIQKKLLMPAQDALVEIELSWSAINSSERKNDTTTIHVDKNHPMIRLHNQIKEAIDKSLQVKVTWMLAASGVLTQVILMNQYLIRSVIGKVGSIVISNINILRHNDK